MARLASDCGTGKYNVKAGNPMDISQVGICFFPDRGASRIAAVAQKCERLGFGFLGVGDVQSLWPDLYVELTLAATVTEHIAVGPWVTNPLTRHPTVTANAIGTLNELTAGRAFLGIGVGDGALRGIGAEPASLSQLEKAVDEIRTLFAKRSGCGKIPIYWASASRRSTELGAQLADGVIVSGWIVPEMLRDSIDQIRHTSLGRSGPAPTRIFNTALSIDDDSACALNLAKPYVARALARPSSAKVPGWSLEDVERFRGAYNFAHHFKSEQELRELVPDAMVRKKAIAGCREECLKSLQEIVDAAFQKIAVIPLGNIDETLETLAHDLVPKIEERRGDSLQKTP